VAGKAGSERQTSRGALLEIGKELDDPWLRACGHGGRERRRHERHGRPRVRPRRRHSPEEFGADVAQAYRDGAVDFGRRQKPQLVSEGASPSSIPFAAILGLNGLAIESAESPDWPKGLDDAAAERAFRVAMYELNGFPPWMPRLFAHSPALVKRLALAGIGFQLSGAGA